jgi:hypothetical protein
MRKAEEQRCGGVLPSVILRTPSITRRTKNLRSFPPPYMAGTRFAQDDRHGQRCRGEKGKRISESGYQQEVYQYARVSGIIALISRCPDVHCLMRRHPDNLEQWLTIPKEVI